MNETRTPSMTPHQRLPAPRQRRPCPLLAIAPRVVVATVLALCSLAASANRPDNITAAEMALIPAYCKDANTFGYGGRGNNASPNAPKWVAMMGDGFWAVHHYCWALINLMRVQGPQVAPNVKQFAREMALGDLAYSIENAPPDYILLPEILTKRGQVQLDLKELRAADASFARARAIKPDYWPAYSRWASYLLSIGQKEKAKQLVEEGLSYSPDSKTLRDLLIALGGDPNTVKRKSNPKDSAPDSARPAEPKTPSGNDRDPTTVAN